MWCNWQHIGLPNRRCRIITGYPFSEGEGRHFLTSGQTNKYSRRPQARSSALWAGSRKSFIRPLHCGGVERNDHTGLISQVIAGSLRSARSRKRGILRMPATCSRDYHILSTTSRLTISVQGNIIYSCGLCAVTLIQRWCENQMGSTYRASP